MSEKFKKFMEDFVESFESNFKYDSHSMSNRLARYNIEDENFKKELEKINDMLSSVYSTFKEELKLLNK